MTRTTGRHRRRSQVAFAGRGGLPTRGTGLDGRFAEAVILVAALLFGLVAGVDPLLAVAMVAGLTVAAITFTSLAAGLCIFVVVAFLETLPQVGGAASVSKVMGVLLVVGWVAGAAISHPEERSGRDLLARHPLLVWTLVLFVTWALFSTVWAEVPSNARATALRFALNFALFPIVFAALRTARHVQALYGIFVFGALLSAAVGFASHTPLTDDGRLGGAGLNANQLGQLLMVAIVLALTLAANRAWPFVARLLLVGAALAAGVALFGTASRGSLLGLAIAMAVTPFLIGRGRRLRALAVIVSIAVVSVVWVSAFAADSLAVQRLTQASHSGSGRVDIWTIGLRMVDANPVLGVGAGNFKAASIHYLLEPGAIARAEFIIDEPKVPHNIYLHVLAELGAVGLVLFLAVLAYCLSAAWRAARAAARRSDTVTELLSRGLLIALIGLLCADFFSSQLYSKQLWLLLATTLALLAIAERTRPSATPQPTA